MELRLHPQARLDISEAHAWYLEEDRDVAASFRDALEAGFQRIRNTPETWPMQKIGARRYLLHRFPFSVFYTLRDDVILIIAVAHQKRAPGYFANRLSR